jgi:hypothetical protein
LEKYKSALAHQVHADGSVHLLRTPTEFSTEATLPSLNTVLPLRSSQKFEETPAQPLFFENKTNKMLQMQD